MSASRVRVGCTGWGYDDWRGGFYPEGCPPGEYLERYARVFDFTEIDSSYYRAPSRGLVARWAAQTPEGFLFSPKLPGAVTHEAKLRGVDGAVAAFLDALEPLRLAGKLGPVVASFPPSFARDADEPALRAFLEAWPRDRPLVVELRNRSWWTRATYDLLEARGVPLVWSATQYGRTPPVVTASTLYVRLIGDRALVRFGREQRDATDEMRYWKARLEDEGASARSALVVLNNHLAGFAPASAQRMREVLALPPLDLAAARRDEGQRRLF